MTGTAIDVLVAEDNPSDAELVLESFAREGLAEHVWVVRDGEEALDFLFQRRAGGRTFDAPPRLIVLDIKLPKVDGFDVLREVKSDARTRVIPVVMFTSSSMESDVRQAYALGVNSYVQKPVDFELFRQTVRQLGRFWIGLNQRPVPGTPGEEY